MSVLVTGCAIDAAVLMPPSYALSLLFFLFFLFSAQLSAEEPQKASYRLSKSIIGDDGRIYACCNNYFLAFETNGSIAWSLHLNYKCDTATAPVQGGFDKVKTCHLFFIPRKLFLLFLFNLLVSRCISLQKTEL